MITSRTYHTTPGATLIGHWTLVGVRILGCHREGIEHTRVAAFTALTGPQFAHTAGRIIFDTSFPFNAGETVWVLYET